MQHKKSTRASRKQLAMLHSLRRRKGRKGTGLFLVEGRRLCEELAQAGMAIKCVLVSTDEVLSPEITRLAEQLRRRGAALLYAPDREVQKIADTVHSQGIIAAARWEEHTINDIRFARRAIVVALDRVSDPGNVGAIIRTAAWFDATAVLLGAGCADLLNPKTVRATMGGLFHLPVCRNVIMQDAFDKLKELGFAIAVAAADGSPDWRSWSNAPRAALVLGSEAHGVVRQLRERAGSIVAIPRQGAGESLNVAVTAGVFLSATPHSSARS